MFPDHQINWVCIHVTILCHLFVYYFSISSCIALTLFQLYTQMMSFDFSGKRVLVTGAGRGLGRHLSTSIARAGGEVYALGRNKDDLASLAAECELVHPVIADLNNCDETKEVVSKLDVMHGVVNNAATSNPWTPALEVPRDMIERTLNVNLLAAVNVIQITGKKMVDTGVHGSIVNVSR